MRVLMVIAPVPGTNAPPVWARRQIDSLKAIGVIVDTFVFRDRRSISGLLNGALALRRRASAFHADVVHIHFGAAQAVAGVLASNRPVVLSLCGSDLMGNYDARGRKTYSGALSGLLTRLGVLGCTRAIAKSNELKASLGLGFLSRKCDIIPNGVDLALFRPIPQEDARTVLGWKHRDPVVLFMDRRGAWVKDPYLAHASYHEARKLVPTLRLYVAEQEPPDRMPLFLNAADALLLTSRHEGSNNTVKEALACNLPIIATACGDTAERMAGVSHSHICPRDAQDLGRKLAEVVTMRPRSNGRRMVQSLALEVVAMRIKQMYEAALESRRAGGSVVAGYRGGAL